MSLLSDIAIYTGMREELVAKIARTAPFRYKTYFIDKRSGGKREISQPAREVKVLQRALIDLVLSKLPVHDAAMAYREGRSIRDNANVHANSGPILKMDFKDFFPSIKAPDWARYCASTGRLTDPGEIELTSRLLFKNMPGSTILRLSIGAPSSPVLSNVLLYDFDQQLGIALADGRVRYSRYADDLTFSAPRTGYLHEVQDLVKSTLKGLVYPRLKINEDKTTYVTRKFGRRVTGLVLANDGRVTIGKAAKRVANAAVCNAKRGLLDKDALRVLAGKLAHINSVEPEFLDVLRRKYGTDVVTAIQKTVVIPERPVGLFSLM